MAKNWGIHEVPTLISNIYQRVLERDWDPVGLIFWGSQLDRGEMSVREVVRRVALSEEHMARFIKPHSVEEAVKICYRHLLAREADPGGLQNWVKVFQQEGVDNVIHGIVDSNEYMDRFGEDGYPKP